MSQLVFDVVAKYPQKQHIATQMQKTSMQKLRGNERHRLKWNLCEITTLKTGS